MKRYLRFAVEFLAVLALVIMAFALVGIFTAWVAGKLD